MSPRRIGVAGAMLVTFAGCAALPAGTPGSATEGGDPGSVTVSVVSGQTQAEALLSWMDGVRRMSPAELAREFDRVRTRVAIGAPDDERLKLAAILAMPGSAHVDETRALELLEPLARSSRTDIRAIAGLLSTFAQENRRLQSGLQVQQQNSAALQQAVQAHQQTLQTMQQKLDALKTMERSLLEREQAGIRRR